MKLTKRKISIIAFALILLLSFTAFLGINSMKADAKGTITVSGTNVFTATGDAKVGGGAVGTDDDVKYYTTFTFSGNEDVVSYRRNLAYNWWYDGNAGVETDDEDEDTEVPADPKQGWFNMEIGFDGYSFEKFVITFESQQFNKTKDSKSVNYLIFFPANANYVNVLITDDKDAELEEGKTYTNIDGAHIKIEFTEKSGSGYDVKVSDTLGASVKGRLENVGGNYAKSSTSSTSPVYPLIFNTQFAESEGEEQTNENKMVLFSLNGQSFETTSSTANTVTDNASPVLCLTEDVRYFSQGGALDVDYVVIDVLRTSPTATLYYYVLTCDDFYGEAVTDFNSKSLFEKADSNALLESDYDKYLPTEDYMFQGNVFNKYSDEDKTLTVDMLVKVYIDLSDSSSTSSNEPGCVYLDWYVPSEYLINVNKGEDSTAFMAVAKDELGVTYNYDGIGAKGEEGYQSWEEIVAEYQAEVTELAKNISAGTSSYLYLPSAEKLFTDNANSYTDLKFSIYFYHNSQSSNTSLASNNLSINVTRYGWYTFTIYATDAAGNQMYYIDEDGVIQEFAASEIWDMYGENEEGGRYHKLPWFEFNVTYSSAEFEETPGMQATAYVGTSYSSATFKINGITGNYTTTYRLFLFDRAKYFNDKGVTFSYEAFIEQMDDLFQSASTRVYFEEITVVTENDEDYEKYKDYGWTGTSTTFTPQVANAFYYIRAELTDSRYQTKSTSSLAVVSSETAKSLKGEDNWLENNVASVVLLSVAGLAFIGIILLLVIKPKDKEDIDVRFEKSKKNKK